MASQIKKIYKITALTNLHVGSGDQNYGIVDKLIQRDPLTQFPIIHASSLKGALREYCKEELGLPEAPNSDLINAFGDEKNQGLEKFFSAHLFTIPVRSDIKPFFRATCPAILKEILGFLDTFGMSHVSELYKEVEKLSELTIADGKQFIVFDDSVNNCLVEDYSLKEGTFDNKPTMFNDKLKSLFNWDKDTFMIIRDDIFMEICENLPVVARNRLGENKNLWYEELVQRQTEFYFFYVGTIEGESKIMNKIVEKSTSGMPVQIGANASVGYGYCSIKEISQS
jgi:CRISPR-associated protein Cmr4